MPGDWLESARVPSVCWGNAQHLKFYTITKEVNWEHLTASSSPTSTLTTRISNPLDKLTRVSPFI
jgi:hypothetical protein